MIRLASRRNLPPGGIQFVQAETGWHSWEQAPGSDSSFDMCKAALIAHRQANPRFNLPTDDATVAAELDFYNATRLKSVANAQSYYIEDSSPPIMSFHSAPPPSRLAAVGAAVGKLRAGAKVLSDWLGEGGQPVEPGLALKRAETCVNCPKNSMSTLSRWWSIPVAAAVKKMLEARQDLNLSTPLDDKLGVCETCLCSNRLKIFVPLEFIKTHTAPEVLADFPSACWIPTEIKELTEASKPGNLPA